MKTLWNIVSFLAVVHLLALVMFVGWLWKSGRLDSNRIDELRAMLAMTIPEAQASADRAAEQAALEQRKRADESLRQNPGLPSGERMRTTFDARQSEQRSVRRISDVKAEYARQMAQAQARIDEQREALEARQQSIDSGAAGEIEQQTAEQLKKTVKLLESLPPKQAKRQIVELVNSGDKDQAVIYLDAMNQRIAGKVLAEFKTDDEVKLAKELLERVRTLGRPDGQASDPTDSSDANGTANTR
jgi:hypothetical protein